MFEKLIKFFGLQKCHLQFLVQFGLNLGLNNLKFGEEAIFD